MVSGLVLSIRINKILYRLGLDRVILDGRKSIIRRVITVHVSLHNARSAYVHSCGVCTVVDVQVACVKSYRVVGMYAPHIGDAYAAAIIVAACH